MGGDSANVSRRKHRVLTCREAVFQTKSWSYGGLTVVLRWSYGGLMIQVAEKCLELSTDKGTKKVRETSDMVMVPTENTKDTKIKIPTCRNNADR